MGFIVNYKMEKLNIFKTKDQLFKEYTDLLITLLDKKETVNISLSGGSTPKALFSYWAEKHKNDIPWSRVNFFWGDERCVPPDHEESNFGMTKKYLFDHINIPQENIFRILGENDPVEEAQRYGMILEEVLDLSGGIPEFDIMMLGLGDDGHTASIFPHQIELWNNQANCVVGIHPVSGQKRVSLTGKVINNAHVITFLVTGENKETMVEKLVEPTEEEKKVYPAALVKPEQGNLAWFLDEAAAKAIQ